MSRFLVLCLILADVCAVLAMPSTTKPIMYSFANAPSSSPLSPMGVAEVPTIRKLGKQAFKPVAASGLIPAQAPSDVHSLGDQEGGISQVKGIHLEKHHHNIDKSIAGGGVILGGLATTFLVAIFCYIRATRRKSVQPSV